MAHDVIKKAVEISLKRGGLVKTSRTLERLPVGAVSNARENKRPSLTFKQRYSAAHTI